MDPRFLAHNAHLDGYEAFLARDPQMQRLAQQVYQHESTLLTRLPSVPGIYTLGGGRQLGKTTLLKQWMGKLLQNGVESKKIAFMTGELIDDHHSLVRLIDDLLSKLPLSYLIIDEVTYIKDWDKGIKYLADLGVFGEIILVLTGSDLSVIRDARVRFPGRRGKADIVDFHLYPLSFYEVATLTGCIGSLEEANDRLPELYEQFDQYLIHGGYLTAINDLAAENEVTAATLATYSDWIRGDVLKRAKQENYLREIIAAIIKRYNSQITWNSLAKDLSIDHPKTVADYIGLLESMDAVFVQSALLEDKLAPAPKKAKKVIFTDVFIYHALKAWVNGMEKGAYQDIMQTLKSPQLCSQLVEACVASHYRRFYPTYYIKAQGEVDVAYIKKRQFWPVEIKWTEQLRAKDIKQITRYQNGRLLAKTAEVGTFQGIPVWPLPLGLLKIGIE